MAGKKAGGGDVALEDLQALGREMQEGVGFDPAVQFKETDYDDLLFDVKHNAKDLDPVKDANAISEKGRRTLVKIKAGPWWDGEEQEPAPPEEEQRTSQRRAAKTKPAKTPEKPEDEDVGKKGKKGKATATAKPKQGKKEPGKPGVIASILDIIVTKGPVTKEKILKELVRRFPDRVEESMKNTINVQIPGRLQKEKNITLVEVEGKGWKKK